MSKPITPHVQVYLTQCRGYIVYLCHRPVSKKLLLQFSIGMPRMGHYSSQTRINVGGKTGPLFESHPRPLLKSGLQPLGRYGTHQETISRRPEQMYTPSDTGLEWLGEGLLFKLDSNKRLRSKMQPIF